METFDIAIIGGGIVGAATARRAQILNPGARIVLFEKESALALHQTGRNSGVIHAGVYYPSASHKARFCREGQLATKAYCEEHGLPFEICGKLIVSVDEAELARMEVLYQRSKDNGISIERLNRDEARRLEPNIKSEGALLSPSTGITDFGEICQHLCRSFVASGGILRLNTRILGGSENVSDLTLRTNNGEVSVGHAVFCTGLMADRVARAFGADIDFRIVPFRGEYFRINNQPEDLVRHLIYPVPDPDRPFLGVHLTRKLDGGFTVGPNAVLAMAREGYGRLSMNPRDMADSLTYPGFWKLVSKNAASAVDEMTSSLSRGRYLNKVHRYCDTIRLADLSPYRPGIRAQAVSSDGRLIDDFLFVQTSHSLHVCNAPSPAATSALPIAEYIVNRLLNAGS